LIVEDEPSISRAYQDGLRYAGYEVATESSGQDAINYLTSVKPDVVLMDILMPGVNGLEVLRYMRATENLKSIPVIVLTNLEALQVKSEAQKWGVQHFLIKAENSLEEIVQVVGQILGE
jgi:CheY-like chemotaxis protein